MAVLMRGLEDAFADFGGVPAELLFDQMKAVIIDDEREIGGKLLENLEFVRFAAHWGFRIRACRPYRAQHQGQGRAPDRLRARRLLLRPHVSSTMRISMPRRCRGLTQTANARMHRTTA